MGSLASALAFGLGADSDASAPDETLVQRYATTLKQLLPPGTLFKLEPGSTITNTLSALGMTYARLDGRGSDLVNETDPRTAAETLPDWESMLGLPDSAITTIPMDDASRRLAITQKYAGQGGQTPAYFVGVAASCGYTATITDGFSSQILRAGFRAGDRSYGNAWAFVWQVNVAAPSGTALDHTSLEAVIRRLAPSHTTVVFVYS